MKRKWTKRASALLLALVLAVSLLPTAALAASNRTMQYQVKSGESVTIGLSDFEQFFRRETDLRGDLGYIEFTEYSDLDDYGYLMVDGKRLDEGRLDDRHRFYADSRDIRDKYWDHDLSNLRFVANERARGTLRLGFDLVSNNAGEYTSRNDRASATLEISVGYSDGSVNGSRLSYRVDEGSRVQIDERDFRDVFNRYNSSGSIFYMQFTQTRGLDRAGVLTAKDKDGRVQELDEYSLRNARFYHDQKDLDFYRDGYLLETLTFEAKRNISDSVTLNFHLQGVNGLHKADGTIELTVGRGSSGGSGSGSVSGRGDINYETKDGEKISLDERDFRGLFLSDKDTSGQLDYVRFTNVGDLDRYGYFTARDKNGYTVDLYGREMQNGWFYVNQGRLTSTSDYELDSLRFIPKKDVRGTLRMEMELVGSGSYNNRTTGTMDIQINGGDSRPEANAIRISLDATGKAAVDVSKLERFFKEDRYTSGSLRYVEFTNARELGRNQSNLYYDYGYSTQTAFNSSNLERYRFYTTDNRDGDYPLDRMTFVASPSQKGNVTLGFRAWGNGSNNYVDGELVFEATSSRPDTNPIPSIAVKADIIYATTPSAPVQINANDLAQFYRKSTSGGELMYVRFLGVPKMGALYYNYYGASSYGTTQQELMTAGSIQHRDLYYSPRSQADYALTELTYLPSTVNNCSALPFLAMGTSGNIQGTIYISTSTKTVPEVYGVTVSGGAVNFPTAPVYSAVNGATGVSLSGIRLLRLPKPTEGRIEIAGGVAGVTADTARIYTYSPGGWSMNDLRFVPAPGFTGNVEIPYAACDAQGNAIAAGKVSLGVVTKVKTFKDVNKNSTWCYKYVTELSSSGVIDGYSDGTFKEKNPLTYGAALKLIMLGAGYPEQAPTVKNSPFSGYLAKAKADGLVDAKAKIDLKKPITRLQVSQIAAKALKLNVSNLNSVKPFTDTQDVYVQALNAAGIVEGYFSNGKSTFQPNATLTRGHISAIVWRMQQYRK